METKSRCFLQLLLIITAPHAKVPPGRLENHFPFNFHWPCRDCEIYTLNVKNLPWEVVSHELSFKYLSSSSLLANCAATCFDIFDKWFGQSIRCCAWKFSLLVFKKVIISLPQAVSSSSHQLRFLSLSTVTKVLSVHFGNFMARPPFGY